MKRPAIIVPEGCKEVLLHACCAPCSSAIVEWLVQHDIRPVIFYYNPNIYPREEYEIRKNESKRHAESLGLKWIDGDYDHEQWLEGLMSQRDGSFVTLSAGDVTKEPSLCDIQQAPERGIRCERCFIYRLTAAAKKAQELGIRYFTTTLASSRWKSLEQIERAGHLAEQIVSRRGQDTLCHNDVTKYPDPGVTFWAQNWRKGGLYERRNQLLKEFNFYNQQYCGCEFSQRNKS